MSKRVSYVCHNNVNFEIRVVDRCVVLDYAKDIERKKGSPLCPHKWFSTDFDIFVSDRYLPTTSGLIMTLQTEKRVWRGNREYYRRSKNCSFFNGYRTRHRNVDAFGATRKIFGDGNVIGSSGFSSFLCAREVVFWR